MFGRDPEIVKLQRAMRNVGADPNLVKNWFKTLDKMRKIAPSVRDDYERAYNTAQRVRKTLEKMESVLANAGGVFSDQERRLLKDCRKTLHGCQGKCDHDFVVSPEDKEFHSTFDVLMELEPGRESKAEETLLLQSEVENLLSMVRECLERESPTLVWLCYFNVKRPGRDLAKLSPKDKLAKIRRIYENEFVQNMRTALTDSIQEAYRLRDAAGQIDKSLEILLSKETKAKGGELTMVKTREDCEKQADEFMVSLCSLEG